MSRLRMLNWQGSEAELIDCIMEGHPDAGARLFDRYGRHINRVVFRVLGGDADHDDLVHDIFIKIWGLIGQGKVRQPESLSSWVASVATHLVYKELRRRYVRRKLLRISEEMPEGVARVDGHEARDLLLTIYELLTRLPPAERLAFSLRHLDQQRLVDVAQMCDCSLSTIKRRLARAEARFAELATAYPAVIELIQRDRDDG